MNAMVYRVRSAVWRASGENEFERLRLKRSRLRVEETFATVYFYLEDREQVRTLHARGERGEHVEIELYLEDKSEPEIVTGVPKLAAPPYIHPPYHMKMHVDRNGLTITERPLADQ